MQKNIRILFFFLLSLPFSLLVSAQNQRVVVGADQLDLLLEKLEKKKIGLVCNQTAVLSNEKHTLLLDTLVALGVDVKAVFSPEHGFRGEADAGAVVSSGRDEKTGVSIISLYGQKKKPTSADLEGIDLMLYDIQDVGCRFYTYISTLHYLMEACAENRIPLLVLDRPNPNDVVDGPILDPRRYRSFVGMHPIPVLYGLTVGELAQMINGEDWLSGELKCDLEVIPLIDWKHGQAYSLPIAPSPNLKSDLAIRLYPSLCFFEGTSWSVGRGTSHPFEQIGHPSLKHLPDHFIPRSRSGAVSPKFKDRICYGFSYVNEAYPELGVDPSYLLQAFLISQKHHLRFFSRRRMFDLLAGTDQLRKAVQEQWSVEKIHDSWKKDLEKYALIRKKYLLYEDGSCE